MGTLFATIYEQRKAAKIKHNKWDFFILKNEKEHWTISKTVEIANTVVVSCCMPTLYHQNITGVCICSTLAACWIHAQHASLQTLVVLLFVMSVGVAGTRQSSLSTRGHCNLRYSSQLIWRLHLVLFAISFLVCRTGLLPRIASISAMIVAVNLGTNCNS